MISLRPVQKGDLGALFRIHVANDQRDYVAPNSVTLAESAFEKGSCAFTIRDGDQIVGLLACIDFRVNDDLGPGDDTTSIFLWRFMIEADRQGIGHGRAAMVLFVEWCRVQKASAVTLEVVETNSVAASLYRSLGFSPTGRKFGKQNDEIEYRLAL